MPKALVTGCAGFIGSHLTESLLEDGVEVLGVDCFNDNYGRPSKLRNLERAREWHTFEFVPVDLSRGDLTDLVCDVDYVFHLAAEPGVRQSWSGRFETYLRNNLLATHQLLNACKRWPDKRFVYASSSSVYGQAETFPVTESAVPRPFSPYGVTKLSAEQLCFSYHQNHGMEAVALRYFTVYGPRQRPDMAFTRFCHAVLAGSPITIYGDGTQTRDFTFVDDVVSATRSAAIAECAVGRVYNVGGGSRTSLRAVLDLLAEISGRDIDVIHHPVEQGDVRDTAASTARARADLGFEPATALPAGLQEQFAWAAQSQGAMAAALGPTRHFDLPAAPQEKRPHRRTGGTRWRPVKPSLRPPVPRWAG